MPLYTFACEKCGAEFETLVAAVGAKPDSCPHCGSSHLGRVYAPFAVGTFKKSNPAEACGRQTCCGGCPAAYR